MMLAGLWTIGESIAVELFASEVRATADHAIVVDL